MKIRNKTNTSSNPDWSIVTDLERLGSHSIVSEEALADMFDRCGTSVKRAIERNELPPSIRLFGKPCWTVGTLVAHIELRLEMARLEMENERKRLEALCP